MLVRKIDGQLPVIQNKALGPSGEQYVLLSNTSKSQFLGQSGIITFAKVSFDVVITGLYSFARTLNGYQFYSTNSSLKGYRVTRDGVEYLSIKKPDYRMTDKCTLMRTYTFAKSTEVFEVINESELTDIVEL